MGERNALLLVILASVILVSCEALFTEAPAPGEAFDEPLEGLTMQERAAFARGDEGFAKTFTVKEGLVQSSTSRRAKHAIRATAKEIPARI